MMMSQIVLKFSLTIRKKMQKNEKNEQIQTGLFC